MTEMLHDDLGETSFFRLEGEAVHAIYGLERICNELRNRSAEAIGMHRQGFSEIAVRPSMEAAEIIPVSGGASVLELSPQDSYLAQHLH